MKLYDILNNVSYTLLNGALDIDVKDIKYDSRKVEEGDLFVALVGYNMDGHEYVDEAINRGATVIVTSRIISNSGVTIIKVDDTRVALAHMAANYFGNPDKELFLIGVTGTTGKTTTTHMIKDILVGSNVKCGLIGSIGIKYNDKVIHVSNTTPESYEVFKAFREMRDAAITHVVMETSSQSFKLHRLAGIIFDIGVLTNLTTDHIGPGEHASQEEYVLCKRELLFNSRQVVINNDSSYLEEVLKGVKAPIRSFAVEKSAQLEVQDIKLFNEANFLGSEFQTTGIVNDTFRISIPGEFNIYNAVCAIAVVSLIKEVDVKNIKQALLNSRVRGRMEIALVRPKFKVLIDYAHTEDGMRELVKTLRAYNPKRLVSVFGGGGNRPKERRYNLGEIIGGSSDLCIITEDNPRFEDINLINNDIKVGLDRVGAKYIEIPDRKEAIKYAILNALEGDLILLVGKGHEDYQDVKGEKIYFNELEVIRDVEKLLS